MSVIQPLIRPLIETEVRGLMGRAVGGGVALPPTTNMEAWFRKGVGITSAANAVSNWANQAPSGAARDYAQATGAAQPTLQAGGTILFDGTSDYMRVASFSLIQPYTRYVRLKQKAWTNNMYIFDGIPANTGILLQTGVTPSLSIHAGTTAAANAALTLNTWGSVGAVFNGASSVLNINGTEATGNVGAGNPGGLTLGADGGTPSLFTNIEVAEEIVYNVAHDASQRAAVIAYLNTL